MMTEISREGLYRLVWEKPITVLEKELEVSYHEIKGICKKKDIPMPESAGVGGENKADFGGSRREMVTTVRTTGFILLCV